MTTARSTVTTAPSRRTSVRNRTTAYAAGFFLLLWALLASNTDLPTLPMVALAVVGGSLFAQFTRVPALSLDES